MKKIINEIKPLIDLLNDEKKKLFLVCSLVFICGLGDLFYGYLNGRAIEEITNGCLKESIIFLSIYFLIEILFENIIGRICDAKLQTIESKLTRRIGLKLYEKTINLPAVAFEKMSSGQIINRISNDAATLSFVFGRLLNILVSFLVTFVIFFYIVANSWIVALEIIIIVFLLLITLKKYNPLIETAHKERKEENDKFTSLANESVRGIREIKTLGIIDNLSNNAKDIIKVIFEKSKKEIDINLKFKIITKILRTSLECLVFVTCAILMYYGKISLTFFVAMTYYVYRYTWLIEEVNDFSAEAQKIKVAIKRINEIIDNRLYQDEEFGLKTINNLKGVVNFNNVTFGYPDEEAMLRNFNLEIKPGKKIAIVGRSGQGKSTLFNLLTRIFDVDKGNITIDGIDIRELSRNELRNNISIIRQEPFVFNRSIMENFKIVNPNITLKEIKKYCKLAYIDEYIESLPKKYHTVLGEGGVNLSGGQKQRLAIARTLSKQSKIILFDEATSALDNESQEFIKKSINSLVKDHTVIIVAHRLSTIIDADIIHVVDGGKVVASGTHDDLIINNETYSSLYQSENL